MTVNQADVFWEYVKYYVEAYGFFSALVSGLAVPLVKKQIKVVEASVVVVMLYATFVSNEIQQLLHDLNVLATMRLSVWQYVLMVTTAQLLCLLIATVMIIASALLTSRISISRQLDGLKKAHP